MRRIAYPARLAAMGVVGYRLALAEVARVPDGEGLYDDYLGELERILAGK